MATEIISLEALKSCPEKCRANVALFLKRLQYLLEKHLGARSPAEKNSEDGRLATIAYKQGQIHLRSVFKLLSRGDLPADVLTSIVEISAYLQQREYVQANNTYLRLAIGNVPWPIGVIAVGIHERSGQERIYSSQVAHVPNDESTHKWIQEIKGLITFCQLRYPPTDDEATAVEAAGANSSSSHLEKFNSVENTRMSSLFPSAITIKNLTKVGTNVGNFHLTLWGNSRSVIAIFQSQRSATIASQCVLSSRPFSTKSFPACTPENLLWSNLYLPMADKTVRYLFGCVLFILLNFFYSSVTFLVTSLVEDNLPAKVYEVVKPVLVNILLAISPYITYSLCLYQGFVTKGAVQLSLNRKLSLFLFLQIFALLILRKDQNETLADLLKDLFSGNLGHLVRTFFSSDDVKPILFMNLVVQKAFVSSAVLLLNPGSLVFWIFTRFIRTNSPRGEVLNSLPATQVIGMMFPTVIVLVYLMDISLIVIAPLLSLFGLAYFACTYSVLKYQFVYSFEVIAESGGQYGSLIPTIIFSGCLMSQIFTLFRLNSLDGSWQMICLFPLIVTSIMFTLFFERIFGGKDDALALGPEDNDHIDYVSQRVFDAHERTLQLFPESAKTNALDVDYDGEYEVAPVDSLPRAGELSLTLQEEADSLYNPNRNPSVRKRLPHLLLPKNFFALIKRAILELH